MMPLGTYILGIVAALFTLGVVIEMLRRRRMRERHAVWWLVAGCLALIIGVFPQVLAGVAVAIGVEIPTNLVFFVSILVLFLVSIQHSSELTTLEQRSRTLAEESALQDLRITELERRLADGSHGESHGTA
ncbi:hypothetical protein SAMN06295974_3331 [Plantibacter flavus]|uniref:DUF2304 domain-containing protein n=1 Tax=Plantibacter flavus TaxID=150123 RepID=A0A3N2C4J6_9MICO|nr:DUF2304 domain-containing protein [Plantibacter flavus]ROR82435.1 hypothetical protein EDD42_2526 [Plantibacter flavus]SMG44182.1 hypothetical protein SAMN06295974_3331 [Plantibacter flavus]